MSSWEGEGHREVMRTISILRKDDPVEVLYLDHFTTEDAENSKEIAQNIKQNAWALIPDLLAAVMSVLE